MLGVGPPPLVGQDEIAERKGKLLFDLERKRARDLPWIVERKPEVPLRAPVGREGRHDELERKRVLLEKCAEHLLPLDRLDRKPRALEPDELAAPKPNAELGRLDRVGSDVEPDYGAREHHSHRYSRVARLAGLLRSTTTVRRARDSP